MPIPAFDQHGLLPVGVHDCTWDEIQQTFCWNPHRTTLFGQLQDFVAQRWLPLAVAAPLWIDGSFTRKKDHPQDIDIVADVSHLPSQAMGPVLQLFLARPATQQHYNVDFWLKHPLIPHDLTAFFCYTGVKAAAELGLDSKDLKGILRVLP